MAVRYEYARSDYWGSGRVSEHTNIKPIIFSIQEPILIAGIQYFPFVAYTEGRIYTSVILDREGMRDTYSIITASFTGISKDQMRLYVRGTYQRKKGSVGGFVEKRDLDLIISIIKEYNRSLGINSAVTVPDPNIIDRELFEI